MFRRSRCFGKTMLNVNALCLVCCVTRYMPNPMYNHVNCKPVRFYTEEDVTNRMCKPVNCKLGPSKGGTVRPVFKVRLCITKLRPLYALSFELRRSEL
jgi:hypothetical protein